MACIVTVVGESRRTDHRAQTKTTQAAAPEIADGLHRLMDALAIDKEEVAEMAPALMQNLEKGCAGCQARTACQSAFTERRIVQTYGAFCPNATVLDALRP